MRSRGLILFILALSIYACSDSDHAGNGGSSVETENVITAKVLNPQGKPIAGAKVQIRASWFLPNAFSDSTSKMYAKDLLTDANGQFECLELPKGIYTIQVTHKDYGAILEYNHQDTTTPSDLATISISNLGKIVGHVNLPEHSSSAFIQIYGTEQTVETDNKGYFEIGSIPAGTMRIRATIQDSSSAIAEAIVVVRSGYSVNTGTLPEPQIHIEDPLVWRYTRSLIPDSLVSDWMRPITDPTVVVIRLDSTTFDFSQAMPDGRDIRFYDATGATLLYQRSLWDNETKRALIRVRLSSITALEKMEMRWGCPGAIDRSTDSIWTGISDSLKLELYSVLVGDFEANTALTTLPAPIPETYWYVFPFDSTVTFEPADWVEGIVPRDDSQGGNALHLSYTATDSKWIFLGASLDSTPKSFAAMDSVVFWMKGDGLLSFTIDHVGDSGGKAVYNDSLKSEWTRMCITPSMFLPGDQIGGNIGWDAVKDSITNLTFFVSSGTEFWIDDVRIFGINRDDLK